MTAKPRPSAPPHLFAADPDIGPAQDGRSTCRSCSKVGRPGDAQHQLPAAPPEQHAWDARYDPEEGTDA